MKDKEKNKLIYEDFGEMLFTHFGVSGPTILSSSAHLVRYKNIDELEEVMSEFCVIDGIGQDTLFDFRVKQIDESDALKIIEYIEVNPLNTDLVPALFLEAL